MVAMNSALASQSGNLPVYRKRADHPLAWGIVDDALLPVITSLGPWYVGDIREMVAPRVHLRDRNGCKRVMPLSRAVVALVAGIKDGSLAGRPITVVELWERTTTLAQVRFRNRNEFDCQVNNLMIVGHPATTVPTQPMVTAEPTHGRSPIIAEFPGFVESPGSVSNETIDSVRKLLGS